MRFSIVSSLLLCSQSLAAVVSRPRACANHWVLSWTSMQQVVEPYNLPPPPFNESDGQFINSTIRQTFQVSLDAERIRIQLSNVLGESPLPITEAAIAFPENGLAGVGEIDPKTSCGLTFAGQSSVTIPPGEEVYSDPIDFSVDAETIVALTLYLEKGQSGSIITGHPGSRTTSWMQRGSGTNATSISEAETNHWYFASAIEAWKPRTTSSLIVLGDSITDGRGSTDNENNRWPNLLLARLRDEGIENIAVNNKAAGGNAVLSGGLGPPLITRYERDALEQKGTKYVMIFEGVNDIGPSQTDAATQETLYEDLIEAYKKIVSDVKAAGYTTIGATITQFRGNGYYDPAREVTRNKVNAWILTSGVFDHVVDFAAWIGDGDTLIPEYDSGDGLHPNVAGYTKLASDFPLDIFQ
ncbi:SGNH hydrolase-type esterase domain-containing protein [Emericellopsis atlantica]|uniref:SGNH hydrolase-type esterase domain-containing protein n=1 Tax=Emericellopsis atlantica TaxID=2614577 RepID=A0A9P7ZJP0_9HYPO|nr:SGNH hydrolase-type esterase domain-containing protein [Emericellopsis atlantica]KAG9253181.1 SGNH hydrolase-type esterase domain-containing protein [Emericellopsis atlantica]